MRLWCLSFVVGGLLVAGGARAQSNLVRFISQPGDYIGQGLTYVTTNSAEFTFSGTLPFVSVSAFGYGFNFDGPGGSNLTVGVYANATRWPFNGDDPGIDISGNGRGCNGECGTFQILEIHTNSVGQVDHFWVTFSNRCECYFAPMGGEIRYNSQLAPPPPPPNALQVPAQYPTIQSAINAAVGGDTVLVSPGTYVENINFLGKTIAVKSIAGPAFTIIDGNKAGSVVTIQSGEGRSALLQGFTIRNGYAWDGGGINIGSSSPSIIGNIITNNQACSGCGINIYFGSPLVQSNKISRNTTSYSICSGGAGGGFYIGGAAAAEILDNEIVDNVPNNNNGGGMELFAAGTPTIRNNLIKGNALCGIAMANYSDALIVQNIIISNGNAGIQWGVPSGNRGPYVLNNTIADNDGAQIGAGGFDSAAKVINNIIFAGPGKVGISSEGGYDNLPPIIMSNNVYSVSGTPYGGIGGNRTGIDGNISADPMFVDRAHGDYHLRAASPSIDLGNNNITGITATDFDGRPRIIDGNGDGVARIDQGAYEFVPAIAITCPSNIVTSTAADACAATVDYPLPTATPGATVVCQPPPGSIFPLGSSPVVCTASNPASGVISCTFTVTVTDTVAPTIICPPDVTVPCASQVPSPDFAGGSVADNCAGATVSWAGDLSENVACLNRFTIQRMYTATDAWGNTASCSQMITVNDTTAGTITCPANVTVVIDAGRCCTNGVVLGDPIAVGSCGDNPTVVNNAPSRYPRGTNSVVWTATDSCDNSSTCTQLVIVVGGPLPPPSSGYLQTVTNLGPVAYWRLNETSGVTVAADFLGFHNGTISASVTPGVGGPQGPLFPAFETNNTAMQFNYTSGSYLTMPALHLETNAVTITGWIKPTGSQSAWAPIAFCRGGNTVAGLNFGPGSMPNELRYHWNNSRWDKSTGLTVPTNQWSFVALVVTPTNATIYLGANGALNSFADSASEPGQAFDAPLLIGYDPSAGSRLFKGVIDEVAIYRRSLTSTQIQQLYNSALSEPPPPVTPFHTWQLWYFGCTNCPEAAATADSDGDGQNNLAEFLTGTDPASSASALRITAITQEDENIRVTWVTAGGHTNVVQAAPDPGGVYGDVGPNIIITGGGDTTTNSLDTGGATNSPARFYRVRLVP